MVKKRNLIANHAIYLSGVLTFPGIFLVYLFHNNNIVADVTYTHLIFFICLFSAFSIAIYAAAYFFTRSFMGAFIPVLTFWTLFWLFEQLLSVLHRYFPVLSGRVFLSLTLLFVVFLAYVARRYNILIAPIDSKFRVLPMVVCFMFFFNLFTALDIQRAFYRQAAPQWQIKTEFVVDEDLPSPDIYWFNMDGMTSLYALQRHFGVDQDSFRSELLQRGFVINENATTNARSTIHSLSAMFSPTFYDSFFGDVLLSYSHLLPAEQRDAIVAPLVNAGVLIRRDVFRDFELYRAFMAKGYNKVSISQHDPQSPPVYQYFFNMHCEDYPFTVFEYSDSNIRRFLSDLSHLIPLIVMATPLPESTVDFFMQSLDWQPIPLHEDIVNQLTENDPAREYERQLFRRLVDSFSISSPKLVFIQNYSTHSLIGVSFAGLWYEDIASEDFVDTYLLLYENAMRSALIKIDLILENNPNAIIVLQADHGIHTPFGEDMLLEIGFSVEDTIYLASSTFNAVRIPEAYGGLDAPLAPLNITRELVNRFVGVNFELLRD